MSRINLPINQVKLTNVAVVRMTKGGKRFEIACYRNKVVNYRQGIETDLSEVLQTERVFSNVSKGEFAKKDDLQRIFGTTDELKVVQLILNRGDLQIGDLERSQQYESMAREISTWMSEHCVHPVTLRPYTIPQIRQAMKASEYTIHPTRSMKRQYLDCFKKVQTVLSIIRAPMELQLTYHADEAAELEAFAKQHSLPFHGIKPLESQQQTPSLSSSSSSSITQTTTTTTSSTSHSSGDDRIVVTLVVDPSMFRLLEDKIKTMQHVRLEILKQVVMKEGDSNLEDEVRGTQQRQEQQKQLELSTESQACIKQQIEALSLVDHDELPPIQQINRHPDEEEEGEEEQEQEEDSGDDHEIIPHRSTSSSKMDTVTTTANARHCQKQAQKKSKKAKRREKEESQDRKARIQAEETRRAERAELHGESYTKRNNMNTSVTSPHGGMHDLSTTHGEGGHDDNAKACLTCGGSFTPTEYRAHFKSDWHRYNIKLKMNNVAPISEREFLLCDSDAFFDS